MHVVQACKCPPLYYILHSMHARSACMLVRTLGGPELDLEQPLCVTLAKHCVRAVDGHTVVCPCNVSTRLCCSACHRLSPTGSWRSPIIFLFEVCCRLGTPLSRPVNVVMLLASCQCTLCQSAARLALPAAGSCGVLEAGRPFLVHTAQPSSAKPCAK